MKGKIVTAANQILDNHKAEVSGFITDVIAGGTTADQKVLYVKGEEAWYFVHDANDSAMHTFRTAIPVQAGDELKLVSVSAASGTHYAFLYGYKEELKDHDEEE